MNEAATSIIVARSREADRLMTMVVWSIAAHIVLGALVLLLPEPEPEPQRTIMTISLGGAVGPKTGGQTQIGGRAVQAPLPSEPIRRAETAPAPVPPPMTVPERAPRPQPPPPKQAPREATGRTPTTGPQPQEGSTRADTQNRGQGFGLSSGGGGGDGGIRLDVDFCCPEYIIDMRDRIQANWNARQGVVAVTTMKFTISRDGSITGIRREKSSGFELLDAQAQRALQLTAIQKLAPLPQQFPHPTLTVEMEFVYQR